MSGKNTTQPTLVMGVGGAGSHMLNLLARQPLASSLRLICVNTDQGALSNIGLRHLLIGASGQPAVTLDKGKEAAIHSSTDIARILNDAGRLIVMAGLGGGTGSGAAPEIVRIAMNLGLEVRACVAMPAQWEGRQRETQASTGLAALQSQKCTVTVVYFDELSATLPPSTTMEEYSSVMTQVLIEKGFFETQS